MDIMKMGTELLSNSLGGSADAGQASEALSGLLDGSGGLGALAAKMASSGDLSSVVAGWAMVAMKAFLQIVFQLFSAVPR